MYVLINEINGKCEVKFGGSELEIIDLINSFHFERLVNSAIYYEFEVKLKNLTRNHTILY